MHLVGFIVRTREFMRFARFSDPFLKVLRHKPVGVYNEDCKCYCEIGTECLETGVLTVLCKR